MVTATLSRGGTSVDIPLVETAGTPVIGRDIGKPNQQIHESGTLQPRVQDQWSALEAYTLTGMFTDSNAYQDARDLQDLIKSHSGGTDLILDIPLDDFESNISVCPAAEQEEACSVTYDPGRRDWVAVSVSLTRINDTLGSGNQTAQTPTATGNGPITLSDGSRKVEMTAAVAVERTVGRPNSIVRRTPNQYPNFIDHRKAAYDTFDISFRLVDDVAVSQTNAIVAMFRNQLERDTLRLNFNGLFGLGSFAVVPSGTSAVRTTRVSADGEEIRVPTVSLRRVRS